MKRVKFTLGLMLSFLLMGASVVNAEADVTKPYNSSLKTKLYVAGVDSCLDVTIFQQEILDQNGGVYYSPSPLTYDYKGTKSETKDVASYYYGQQSVASNLLYYIKENYTINQKIRVELNYKDGKEFIPVVKRTITLGGWTYKTDGNYKRNEMTAGLKYVDYLIADSAWHETIFDRGTDVATYIYKNDITSLISKFGTIYSITYEVSTMKEYNQNVSEGNGTVNAPVTIYRSVEIDAEGLETAPKATAGIHYAAGHKDFTFTVYSANPISVTTNRGNDEDGVKIVNNGDGSWKVTIRTITSNIKVKVTEVTTESGTGENGTTGNEAIAKDAVWAANGTLYVKTTTPGTMAIYNVTGQLCKQVAVSGDATFTLSRGIYIVQLNGKAYKVVL